LSGSYAGPERPEEHCATGFGSKPAAATNTLRRQPVLGEEAPSTQR